jgi:amino acid transporter
MSTSLMTQTAGGRKAPGRLAREALGLREIFFQSLAAVGPALAISGAIPMAARYAGGAVGVAVILACAPCFTVAFAIGALSKHLPSAGSIYTYPARALHPYVGFLVGWGYAFATALFCPGVALLGSSWIAGQITHVQGDALQIPCAASFCIISAMVLFVGYRGVNVSAKAGTVLGSAEVFIFLALAVSLILAAGRNNTLVPFRLSAANVTGYEGIAGIIAAAVFTTTALAGFEACAPLAEEARDPRRSIRSGAVLSCAIVALVVVVSSYSAVVTLGATTFATFGASLERGNPWVSLAERVWGAGSIAVFLAALSSSLAAQNATAIAASRTWYAMARIGLLPRQLANTHPTWKSPHVAAIAQFFLTLCVGALVAWYFGPVNGSYLLMAVGSSITFGVYVLINVSCTVYFWREKRDEFRWLCHGAIPLLGAVLLIPILMAATGTGRSVLSFVSPLPYPLNLAGEILLVWFAIGAFYLVYLARRRPERLRDTARIFSEE